MTHILRTPPIIVSSIQWLGVRQHIAERHSFWTRNGRADFAADEARDDRNYRSYDV